MSTATHLLRVSAIASLSLPSSIEAAAPPFYELVDLGLAAIAEESWAWDVNGSGQIVGSLVLHGGLGVSAFVWDDGVLAIHAPPGGGPHVAARAIDDASVAVGCQSLGTFGSKFQVVRIADGEAVTVVAGGGAAWANDTNEAGLFCGASDFFVPAIVDDWPVVRGFVAELGGLAAPLTLGGTHGEVLGLNALGDGAGGAFTTGNAAYGAMRVLAGSSTPEPLVGLGGGHDLATAVNDSGLIVGFSLAPDGGRRAARWLGDDLADMGTLGGAVSEAWDVNSLGAVVGMSWTSTDEPHGFVHDGAAIADLNDRLLGGAAWIVSHARAINDAGWIVGWGRHEGRTHACLLRPVDVAPGDLNGSGTVDGADLGLLLSLWGTSGPVGDLNMDLVVDGADLGILLVNWSSP